MRGVWVTGFEISSFIPGAVAIPDRDEYARHRIWLDFAAASPPDPALRAELDKLGTTGAIALEFVGRRSRQAGCYGHICSGEHVVIVDRILSARLLGPLPRL